MTARLRTRVAGLEKLVPRRCTACAGRPRVEGVAFLFNGVLQTGDGQLLAEEDLLPCPVCGGGGGGVGKTIEGVDPGAMLGIRVIGGVDPSVI